MSFILDALKKLEQNRQQGAVPDLMTIHPDSGSRLGRRHLWLVLISVALVLNAVVLALVFAPWKNGDQEVAALAVPGTATAKQESAPPLQSAPVSHISPLPSAGTGEKKTAGVTTLPVLPVTPAGQRPSDAHAEVVSQPAPDSTRPALPQDSETPVEASPAPAEEERAEPMASARLDLTVQDLDTLKETLVEEQSIEETDIPADPGPSKQETEAPGDHTMDFSDLPSDIRSGLPELTISGHIFSNIRQSRLVSINGSVLREGERVSGDLAVEEITLSGVIFTYRGYRFLVRAF